MIKRLHALLRNGLNAPIWRHLWLGSRAISHTATSFTDIRIRNWRQFGEIDIDLTEKVTILTGVNGSGKTTLLRLLAYFVGAPTPFLATPQLADGNGSIKWLSGLTRELIDKITALASMTSEEIGSVTFSDGSTSKLLVPFDASGPQVQVNVSHHNSLPGFLIASHRPVFTYSTVSSVELSRRELRAAYDSYASAVAEMNATGGSIVRIQGTSTSIKNTLLNWGYIGYGSRVAPEDPALIANFEGFARVLKSILPEELKFLRYEIRSGSEIVFICEDGEFLLETASGGITSLIHLAWLIFTFDDGSAVTILIDEIENHLHPSLQRIVLPNLSAAFPNIRFVVSTHSPLVVSSVKGAKVYALRHGDDGKIINEELDFSKDAQTANEILDSVLGVPVTIPLWAEEEYERLVEKYASRPVDEIDLHAFRKELQSKGLKNFVLAGVDRILEAKQ